MSPTRIIWLIPIGSALSVLIALTAGGMNGRAAALYGVAALIPSSLIAYSVSQLVRRAEEESENR